MSSSKEYEIEFVLEPMMFQVETTSIEKAIELAWESFLTLTHNDMLASTKVKRVLEK